MSQFSLRKCLLAKAMDVLALDDMLNCNAEQLKTIVCAAQKKLLLELLCAKPKFYTWAQSPDSNTVRSFCWLHCSFHSESKSTVFAIQDQVLCTRVYKAKVMQTQVQSIMRRLCHEHEETIQHILSSYPNLASTGNLDRHNIVG